VDLAAVGLCYFYDDDMPPVGSLSNYYNSIVTAMSNIIKRRRTGDLLWSDLVTIDGEGTWIFGTEHGRTWLARWQSRTPSTNDEARSSAGSTRRRLFISCTPHHEQQLEPELERESKKNSTRVH